MRLNKKAPERELFYLGDRRQNAECGSVSLGLRPYQHPIGDPIQAGGYARASGPTYAASAHFSSWQYARSGGTFVGLNVLDIYKPKILDSTHT